MIAVTPATERTNASLRGDPQTSIFMANDRLEIRAAVTSQGLGGKGGVEATEPSLKRRWLSVVPDVQGARVSIKKLPLISHRGAVIELEVHRPDVRFTANSGHSRAELQSARCE
jgi:hypothetical protein